MDHLPISTWGRAFAAGIAGAVTLTTVHQLARKVTADAPRMDVLGQRAIARTAQRIGGTRPEQPSLYRMALAGDLFANSAYYSLIACGPNARPWTRAVTLGVAAGVGALTLPQRIGLGRAPKRDRVPNQIMTIAWYLLGALATAATAECLRPRRTAA
jgi:hypothetical protein